MPPLSLILETVFQKFLPVAGTATLVYAAVVFLISTRFRMVGAWLAVALSWGVANMTFNQADGLLQWLPWADGGKPIDWIPWVAMAAMTVGTISDLLIPWVVRLILFILLAGAGAWMLTPEGVRKEDWWMVPAAGGVAGLNSLVSWFTARRHPGGVGALAQSVALMGCAMVLIYAHSAKFMDVSMALSSSVFGIALLASLTKSDAGIATSGLGVLLPGLMLIGWQGTSSEVPKDAFIAGALAPSAMGLALLLPTSLLGRLGWLMPLAALALPVGWALMRSMQFESLAV